MTRGRASPWLAPAIGAGPNGPQPAYRQQHVARTPSQSYIHAHRTEMAANSNSKRMTPRVSVRISNAPDELWPLPSGPRKKPRPPEASKWPE